MGLVTAGTHRPEIIADVGVEGRLQRLVKIQQYIIAWRRARPNSPWLLPKNKQTNHGYPGYLHYLYPPADSITPELIFTTRGNHKQTSGIPFLLARNFQRGTSYKATLLMLLL